MTQKEMDDLTIFMGNGDVFISKFLKGNKISKIRRYLNSDEVFNFVIKFIEDMSVELNTKEFTIDVDNKPKYQIKILND